jgi:hypothetical protein
MQTALRDPSLYDFFFAAFTVLRLLFRWREFGFRSPRKDALKESVPPVLQRRNDYKNEQFPRECMAIEGMSKG